MVSAVFGVFNDEAEKQLGRRPPRRPRMARPVAVGKRFFVSCIFPIELDWNTGTKDPVR